MVNGVKFGISTYISHGHKDYGDTLLALMSRQLYLSKQELLDFIDCRMGGEDYVALMQVRGHLV
ncbi:hypothetical protein KDL44_11530 [bacterium]|nr:hypothetical protein [bacterium]